MLTSLGFSATLSAGGYVAAAAIGYRGLCQGDAHGLAPSIGNLFRSRLASLQGSGLAFATRSVRSLHAMAVEVAINLELQRQQSVEPFDGDLITELLTYPLA